jgi:flagellar FliL protein
LADDKKIETAPQDNPGGNNKFLLILLVVNMVVLVAVGGVVFIGQKKQDAVQSIDKIVQGAAVDSHGAAAGGHGAPAAGGHGAPAGDAAKAEIDIDARFFSVGDFTANLSGPGAGHYVRLNVNLELDKTMDESEVKKKQPQIRDKVITLLNSKRPQDLQNSEGRTFLKEEIKTSVNAFMKTGKVTGVYFSTFVFE